MRFDVPNALLLRGLEAGLYSAASFVVSCQNEIVGAGAIGRLGFEETYDRVTDDTLFDVASLTKPVVTASATLKLVEAGRLTLSQSVGKALEPRYGALPHLDAVDIRHLLTHTSGLPPIPHVAINGDDNGHVNSSLSDALSTPLLRDPGLAYTYSDTGYMLLWEVATIAAEEPLAHYVQRALFEPLGMSSSGFCPASANIASTDPTSPPGVVHDPRARALQGQAGHAGLFTNSHDLLRFADAIRRGGAPILCRGSVDRMRRNQLDSSIGAMSYGWFCAGNDLLPRGDLFSDEAFGHSGFTGCLLLIDPAYDASVILLTNRVLNASIDGVPYLRLRRQWLNTVAAAITADPM